MDNNWYLNKVWDESIVFEIFMSHFVWLMSLIILQKIGSQA